MKAYKVEILIIDFDNVGGDGIKAVIHNQRYPNDCICPHVMDVIEKDIGDWHDGHAMNSFETMQQEYERTFK